MKETGKDGIFLEEVSKRFADKMILDRISMHFERGGIYCVMGESGVGKTTLLRMIMGLEQADSGRIYGGGRFSAVFQDTRLLEVMTAVENVRFVLGKGQYSAIQSELEAVLPKDCIHQKTAQLSGGMKRRVEIVRAMLADCDTICMDEPFAGLDEDNRNMVCEYIKSRRRGRTVIIATHDRFDAAALKADICLLTSDKAVATILRNCE